MSTTPLTLSAAALTQPYKGSCWDLALEVLPHTQRTLLYGAPGTGKTYAAQHIHHDAATPIYSVTLDEDTPASELRGHFIPAKGGFKWHDGPAIRAWREGARLILNEINRASDSVRTLLYAILDDTESAQYTLPTGETLRPAPGFAVVATMNGTPDELPNGLLDRFTFCHEITTVHPDALLRLPVEFRALAQESTSPSKGSKRLSIRAWLYFCTLLASGLTPDSAGTAAFGSNWKELAAALAIQIAPQVSEPTA
jgi:MoxR-like ATPase